MNPLAAGQIGMRLERLQANASDQGAKRKSQPAWARLRLAGQEWRSRRRVIADP
ncbi:hypothetical protein [Bordetella avium]|uniref:hypothetical protein n=1 Tax=Bordetella avium TaxID=521 RepID=UPI001305238D|nr:hypothetical protein [Bordetella avium]